MSAQGMVDFQADFSKARDGGGLTLNRLTPKIEMSFSA
jgi:hypothetical protein